MSQLTFFYEFGVLAESYASGKRLRDEEDEENPDLYEMTRVAIDLREISCFDKIKEIKGPLNRDYKNITNLTFKNGMEWVIFYPYKAFKELWEATFGMKVISLSHPD